MANDVKRGPNSIYLIRHAEKGVSGLRYDSSGRPNEHSLCVRGWQRAGALALLFSPPTGEPPWPLAKPFHIIAAGYGSTKHTRVHRPYQTVAPLAHRLSIDVIDGCERGDEAAVMMFIMGLEGDVLVCWEHCNLTKLIQQISIVNALDRPGTWPDPRFDLVWCFIHQTELPYLRYRFLSTSQSIFGDEPED
jgi:hypothetical protein